MKESLINGNRILAVDDEPNGLKAHEEEIHGLFPNGQFDVATFYEPVVDMQEWV